jgi:formamidopyrimidine-DNA glycosylase
MPELPEVETVARSLRPWIVGREIAGVRLLDRKLLRRTCGCRLADLEGRTIETIRRRGKMILVDCGGGIGLVFHLKMTGQMLVVGPEEPLDKHVRLIVRFRDGRNELRFRDVRRFGFMLCLAGGEAGSCPEVAALGPEPFDVSPESFAALFAGRTGKIKSLLLNQTIVAGIGNIYADEILFDARIHPETPASSLRRADLDRLHASMLRVLGKAVEAGGSTLRDYVDADGRAGEFQFDHKVYDREGEPCSGCAGRVKRIVVGGRGTYFCPRCQRKRPRRQSPITAGNIA